MSKVQEFAEAAKKAEEEFASQFQGEETSTPSETVVNETQPNAESVPEAQPPVESKPSVDEEKYKAAVKAMNEAQRKAAEATKREEEFLKRQQETEARLQEVMEELSRRKQEAEQDDPDDLESDMPEVARLAESKARKYVTPLEKKLDEMGKQLQAWEDYRKQQDAETRAQSMLKEIKDVHPDYDQVVNSDEMVNWINNDAPPIYKQIFDGSVTFTAKDAIAVLDAYKHTTTPTKAKATPSAAEIAAPVRVNTPISNKPQVDAPITAKEIDWFMHNSHKLSSSELAEWDRRLSAT